jgi:hypothetical protein
MRYYDPGLGLFLTQDPVLGNPTNPLSLHRYLYAYQNPTVYIDPDGRESISRLIDQAAEGCGMVTCASLALAKGLYHVATAGFAMLHDPLADARDVGQVTESEYYTYGIGGGLAVAGLNAVTGRVGSALVNGAKTIAGQALTAAAVGAVSGSLDDAASQGLNIAAGLQEGFSVSQNVKVASIGAVVGSVAAGVGHAASRNSRLIAASDGSPRSSQNIAQGTKGIAGNSAVLESSSAPGVKSIEVEGVATASKSIKGEITTPYGPALQSEAAEALAARQFVEQGSQLYRIGTTGKSAAGEAQFWALEQPFGATYPARYGIPPENVLRANFIEVGHLKPGTQFITRPAPPVGPNPGGGIEVVVPENGVILELFAAGSGGSSCTVSTAERVGL